MGSDRAGLLKACSYSLQLHQYLEKERRALGLGRRKETKCLRYGLHVCVCVVPSVSKESLLSRICSGGKEVKSIMRVS